MSHYLVSVKSVRVRRVQASAATQDSAGEDPCGQVRRAQPAQLVDRVDGLLAHGGLVNRAKVQQRREDQVRLRWTADKLLKASAKGLRGGRGGRSSDVARWVARASPNRARK